MPVNSFENYPMSWKPKKEQQYQPLYLSLAAQLEEDISKGKLLPGTKLPPQRELADYLDVNLSTISRALKICSQKGLLSGAVGNGTYVTYDALSNLYLKLQPETRQMINLGTILNEPSDHDELMEILKKMVAEQDMGKLFECGNTEGKTWHRQAAVRLLQEMDCQAREEEILFANGGQNAVAVTLAGVFKRGERIGVDPYTYSGLKTAAKMLGIQLVAIQPENNEMSEEAIYYACKNEKIKGLFIMPDYQNPTTHIMSPEGRAMIARIAKEKNLIIIEDGTHRMSGQNLPPTVKDYAPERTVYLMGLSKVIAPGLRTAYILCPQPMRHSMFNALYNTNLFTSPLLLEITSRMIITGGVQKLAQRNRAVALERNQLVDKYFPQNATTSSNECLFRWITLPPQVSGAQFEEMAQREGVSIYGAERFSVGTEKPVSAARIAVSAAASLADLEEALKILKELVANILLGDLFGRQL